MSRPADTLQRDLRRVRAGGAIIMGWLFIFGLGFAVWVATP